MCRLFGSLRPRSPLPILRDCQRTAAGYSPAARPRAPRRDGGAAGRRRAWSGAGGRGPCKPRARRGLPCVKHHAARSYLPRAVTIRLRLAYWPDRPAGRPGQYAAADQLLVARAPLALAFRGHPGCRGRAPGVPPKRNGPTVLPLPTTDAVRLGGRVAAAETTRSARCFRRRDATARRFASAPPPLQTEELVAACRGGRAYIHSCYGYRIPLPPRPPDYRHGHHNRHLRSPTRMQPGRTKPAGSPGAILTNQHRHSLTGNNGASSAKRKYRKTTVIRKIRITWP